MTGLYTLEEHLELLYELQESFPNSYQEMDIYTEIEETTEELIDSLEDEAYKLFEINGKTVSELEP